MSSKAKLVYAILKFLSEEAAGSEVEQDAKESIDVAKQCLETAYGLEYDTKPELALGIDLLNLVDNIIPPRERKPVTPEEKEQAEKLKTEGNELMKAEKYQEAVTAYTNAIKLDNSNAIYYSNRAAAYNKLNRFYEAVDDCDEAIIIDPRYSKAYGRKGLALSGLNQHSVAIENYKKAIELDPTNQNFKTNLEITEEKAKAAARSAPGLGGGLGSILGGGSGGMPDFASLLNNPAMMNMATQMMQNPQMQHMMGSMLGGGMRPPGTEGSDPAEPTPPGGMENFLRAGQQLAAEMQRTNPELVDQLRSQFGGDMEGSGGPPNDGSEPSS